MITEVPRVSRVPPARNASASVAGGRVPQGVEFPKTIAELRKLPGVGEYTARAVACFAFDKQVAVVDTNVRRVILTQFQISNFKYQIPNEREIQAIADQLLPKGKAYQWNHALMDYASVMLKKEKIPIKRQSPFKNSNRYYRGKIIKLLVQHKKITIETLRRATNIDEARFQAIIKSLVRDGFIAVAKDTVTIA